ncbi:MAG: heavy metal translocating P-type ATPase [bacterium]|jgi:Cu2+-exporting ATPase|nr:heavy metal translocating P-type ATPase [Betaproteobacteria bacterium]
MKEAESTPGASRSNDGRAGPSTVAPADGLCFHCGLPLGGVSGLTVTIGGHAREMCCTGCRAVAMAIVDGGLERYYEHRESMPASAAEAMPQSLAQLLLYDDPAVQASFVRTVPGPVGARVARDGQAHDEREAALLIEGITCAACVWLTERTLARVPGVTGVEVNYATRRARVRWDAARGSLSSILSAIASIGYRASPYDATRMDDLHRVERKRALARLAIAGLGMMQVMMYAFPVWIADGDMTADVDRLMSWAGLILTLPVIVYSAAPIFSAAWRDLCARRVGMDVPVAIGIGGAFGASVFATLTGVGDVYFDSVTMFLFLLLGARYLESQVRARAARATDELARLIPATASLLPAWPLQQPVETVPVVRLKAGDVLLVRPGERIPADGRVLDGEGEVDEALLTGESRPVLRAAGAPVTGGAVNLVSPLVIRVERIGEQTVLAGIVRLLDRAASEKPPLAALADRVAGQFVLGLLLVAAATALWWGWHDPAHALWVTVAVLVITCPCALSLATPAALAAAASALARFGLLPTRGHAIETLARASVFVFDKTGTLTTGSLRVTDFQPRSGAARAQGSPAVVDLLRAVAALEQRSEHPLGLALAAHVRDALAAAGADALPPVVEGLRHVAGGGVEGRVDGILLRLGTPAFVAALSAAPTVQDAASPAVRPAADAAGMDAAEAGAAAAVAMQRGETCVLLGDAQGVLATFMLADQLRPGARELVAGLQADGATVMLLSGDHPGTVAAVAAALGIEPGTPAPGRRLPVQGGMSPEAKLAFVRDLQAGGGVVAMFGDGVNDAPVLAGAQVSIAPASGTQVAQAAADMVWLARGEQADMRSLLGAIRMSRRALRVIRGNLLWATAYNLVAVPLAVAGLVTPWVAAIGMSASSLLVVGNAMRLLSDDPPRTSTTMPTGAAAAGAGPAAPAAVLSTSRSA